ncbi:farnesyltransferase subunit beta [Moniliophthora roreri MCA 2997]|uniref:Protein farnesyltransferase subunit beta n=1 Tax=Moniliophthora roreri (strain MCA 2997) TaxID=1381753 RepID=V2XL17_MONRO|nr:farnesyltransferase subunit beta [Moniliophthora roreri MCA 2997]
MARRQERPTVTGPSDAYSAPWLIAIVHTLMMSPTPNDSFPTPTSQVQAETEDVLAKHVPLSDETVKPILQRNNHLRFLIRNLTQGFPSRYVSQDASQPWLVFWTLQAFSVLQVGMDPGHKRRAIDRILSCQHPEGGFGGGPSHEAHLLPTYAAVCSLAIVGSPGENGGWDQIDRKKLYDFFMSLKQPDGSFTVSRQGEVDVRGIYCLLAVATLLNILTPELVARTPEFIASCQTYEGGFASASHPFFTPSGTLLSSPRPQLGEAHGGYTFCAVASWVLLQPFVQNALKINMRNLVRWLVQMQGSRIEIGGFRGRTNKLVDGCYAWWVGGCFALLEGLDDGAAHYHPEEIVQAEGKANGDEWQDEEVDTDVWNPEALQEYILYAGQHPAGGLRDKPPKSPDSYHTLYCLAGLSAAQHKTAPDSAHQKALEALWEPDQTTESTLDDNLRRHIYTRALSWSEVEAHSSSKHKGTAKRVINATHPLFNLTVTHTDAIMAYFYRQPTSPPRTAPKKRAGGQT